MEKEENVQELRNAVEFYRKVNTLLIEDAKPSYMRSPGQTTGKVPRTRGLNHDTSYMSLTNTELQQNSEIINANTEPADQMGIS